MMIIAYTNWTYTQQIEILGTVLYGGPEGSNTNKKETTNKKNGQANKKLENVKKKTQIKKQKANKKHGSKQEMRRALVFASHHV